MIIFDNAKEVKRPRRTVRYTQSQLRGTGELDRSTIRHQLLVHFGFSPEKPITVRRDIDSCYYEQDFDEMADSIAGGGL